MVGNTEVRVDIYREPDSMGGGQGYYIRTKIIDGDRMTKKTHELKSNGVVKEKEEIKIIPIITATTTTPI